VKRIVWSRINLLSRILLSSGIILFNSLLSGQSYDSKWGRVDSLAKSLTTGEVWTREEAARRLQVKDQIIQILYEQEDGYPIFYVDIGATGSGDGKSWQNAFTRIQDGIDAAYQAGEGWVWVAEGTYTSQHEPRAVTTVDGYTLRGAVQVLPRVMLFGGFEGSETLLEQRDASLHTTIIQGWVSTRTGDAGLRGADMGHQTLIDGFLIQDSGCNADGVDAKEADGGGIKTRRWFSIIRNNRVTDCYAKNGGGIAAMAYFDYNQSTGKITPSLPDVTQIRSGYCPIIDRNTVYRNHAVCGAGAQIRHVEALFCHNVVAYNSHDYEPGETIKHKGIEIVLEDQISDRPVLINNIVWGNVPEPGNPCFNIYQWNNGRPDTFGEAGFFGYNNCVQRPTNSPRNIDEQSLIDVNPLFNNINQNNFTLNAVSPCIGAGLALPDGSPTDIGFYNLRYLVTIDDNGIGATTQGAGWQIAGSNVTISTDSLCIDSEGTSRYVFQSWLGNGSGSYTGIERTVNIEINNDITETIAWNKEVKLDVQSDTETDEMSGWYPDGASVQVAIPSTIQLSDERRVFDHWNIDRNGVITTSTDTSISLSMTSPVQLTAMWNIEYQLVIVSLHGSPTLNGAHWLPEGSQVDVSILSLENGSQGTRYRFLEWQGVGNGAYSGQDNHFAFTLLAPVQETAVWQTEYFLDVNSENGRGSPLGEGWYVTGETASISVDSLIQEDALNRYRFSRWAGIGTGSYSGSEREHEIIMNNPVVENIVWLRECRVDITILPENRGVVLSDQLTDGWGIVGTQIQLKAQGDAENGYGFAGWSGAFSGRINPLSLQLQQPLTLTAQFELGDVRIETEPSGLLITADGTSYQAPRVFYWLPGEKYTIGTATPQTKDQVTRYIFDRWSDGLSRTHQITIPSDPLTYQAFFNPEYALAVQTEHGMASVKGAGWYAPGSLVSLSIDSLVEQSEGTRYRFSRWSSEQGINSPCCQIQLTLNQGIVQEAQWQTQYLLDVSVSPTYAGQVMFSEPGSWFDTGSSVLLTAVPRDTNFTFAGWTGDFQDSSPGLNVQLDRPIQLTARFTTNSVFPPEISGFPDTTIFEDKAIVFSAAQFQMMVIDPNDPIDSLDVEVVNGSPFQADWNGKEMCLLPFANWHGQTEVILKVTDPWEMFAQDTFSVTVISLPDPPGFFSLLEPHNGTVLPDTIEQITFVWQCASNVDENDFVRYEFFIDSDSLFNNSLLYVPSIQDTFLTLNCNTLKDGSYWSVRATDTQGFTVWASESFRFSLPTPVYSSSAIPDKFSLMQNYPNPFNGTTRIEYTLPERSQVKVEVFDTMGRVVRTLTDQICEPGAYQIFWTGRDEQGMDMPTGVYLVQLTGNSKHIQRKMLLVR
jgi:hypothetical protein